MILRKILMIRMILKDWSMEIKIFKIGPLMLKMKIVAVCPPCDEENYQSCSWRIKWLWKWWGISSLKRGTISWNFDPKTLFNFKNSLNKTLFKDLQGWAELVKHWNKAISQLMLAKEEMLFTVMFRHLTNLTYVPNSFHMSTICTNHSPQPLYSAFTAGTNSLFRNVIPCSFCCGHQEIFGCPGIRISFPSPPSPTLQSPGG